MGCENCGKPETLRAKRIEEMLARPNRPDPRHGNGRRPLPPHIRAMRERIAAQRAAHAPPQRES